MTHFKSIESSNGSTFQITYGDCSKRTISEAIEDSFIKDGYSIKHGDLGDRTYVKGNRIARLLLGAFYKYFEFHVAAEQLDDSEAKVSVKKTSSGMSGGLIGMNQVKKELARLQGVLKEI